MTISFRLPPPPLPEAGGEEGTCFGILGTNWGTRPTHIEIPRKTWITRSPAVSHRGGQIPSISANPAIGGGGLIQAPHPSIRRDGHFHSTPKGVGVGGCRGDALTEMPSGKPRAQLAFKDSMIRGILQFTLRIAFRCVLHRCRSQDIRC